MSALRYTRKKQELSYNFPRNIQCMLVSIRRKSVPNVSSISRWVDSVNDDPRQKGETDLVWWIFHCCSFEPGFAKLCNTR